MLRPFGSTFTIEHIQNELRAIEKFRIIGAHRNTVKVLKVGQLCYEGSDMEFYVDMELCGLTLKSYIESSANTTSDTQLSVPTKNILYMRGGRHILDILQDITMGVAYIHDQNEIHRDLKPSNGKIS